MKRMVLIQGIIALTFFASDILAQEECQVLLPRIAVTYNGSCKKGLADGQGEAIGVDHYIGEFRKGLPDGHGIYKWQTGELYEGEWSMGLRNGDGRYTFSINGRDSVLVGRWKDDRYVGMASIPPYIIDYRNGIGRVSCVRTGDRPYVRYVFSRGNVNGLLMTSSSGTENITTSFTGYEQVDFPFKSTLKFSAPNAWMTAMIYCELRLTINQPGAWVVTISY
jgi:hypothetical protein